METSGNRTTLGVTSDIAQQVGARLRRARESIGRSTSALSAKIKVREHYLVAIEDGEWNELPPGLNGRGLVRIYARELAVSVPELDQAANQTVMPAEQDAQAPYQLGGNKKETASDRDIPVVRATLDPSANPVVSARTSEQPVKTSTMTSGTRNVRPTESHQAASRVTSVPPTTMHRMIESTPEEEPLDVVTPDVASILGITLDSIDDRPQPQNIRPISTAPTPVVTVKERATVAAQSVSNSNLHEEAPIMAALAVDDLRAAETPKVEVFTNTPKAESTLVAEPVVQAVVEQALEAAAVEQTSVAVAVEHKTETVVLPTDVVHQTETVSTQNIDNNRSNQNSNKKNKKSRGGKFERDDRQTGSSASNPPVSNEIIEPVVETVAEVKSQVQETAAAHVEGTAVLESTESKDSVGVSAAEQYLKSHTQPAEVVEEAQGEVSKSVGSRGLSIAVGLMAACVLVFVVGRLALQEGTQTTNTDNNGNTVNAEGAQNPASDGASSTEEKAGASASETAPDAAKSVSETTASTAVAGAVNPVVQPDASAQSEPAKVESKPENAAVQQESNTATTTAPSEGSADASEAEPATVDAAENAPAKPTTKVQTTGSNAATLTLSEPIEIQVTADGQRIFSGKHEAGKVEIKFNRRAEIFVQDGSKARLKYSGWDHGALGQAGRKRRIVLNADAFNGGRP
ncbi:MAG: helix-turn-helix domain-containing protein [Silvanigrellaceae bacterium]